MDYYQLRIRVFWDEVVGQALQVRPQFDAEFVHAREVAELVNGTGCICNHVIRQPLLGETIGSPKVANQFISPSS